MSSLQVYAQIKLPKNKKVTLNGYTIYDPKKEEPKKEEPKKEEPKKEEPKKEEPKKEEPKIEEKPEETKKPEATEKPIAFCVNQTTGGQDTCSCRGACLSTGGPRGPIRDRCKSLSGEFGCEGLNETSNYGWRTVYPKKEDLRSYEPIRIETKKIDHIESKDDRINSVSAPEPSQLISKKDCKKMSGYRWYDDRCLNKKEIVLAKANKKINAIEAKEKNRDRKNNYCSITADTIGDYTSGTMLDKKAASKFKKACKKENMIFDYDKKSSQCSCKMNQNFCTVIDPVGKFAPKERLDNLKRIKKYEKQCKKIKGNFEFKRDGNSCHCVRIP
jgi:hypothetical protein